MAVDKGFFGIPVKVSAERLLLALNAEDENFYQLLNNNVIRASQELNEVCEAIRFYILSTKVVNADETTLRVIRNGEKGNCSVGYIWGISYNGEGPNAVYAKYFNGRTNECAASVLEGLEPGTFLQTDGYASYGSVVKDINEYFKVRAGFNKEEAEDAVFADVVDEDIVLCGCLCHSRRRYIELMKAYQSATLTSSSKVLDVCAEMITLSNSVFTEEKTLFEQFKKGNFTEEEFLEKRKESIAPLYDKMKKICKRELREENREALTPKLIEALTYTLNNADTMKNYIRSSELSASNNAQERHWKVVQRGRASSLFASSVRGADAWVKYFMLCRTAYINKVDPTAYIKYLFDEIALMNRNYTVRSSVDWERYLPWNVSKEALSKAFD